MSTHAPGAYSALSVVIEATASGATSEKLLLAVRSVSLPLAETSSEAMNSAGRVKVWSMPPDLTATVALWTTSPLAALVTVMATSPSPFQPLPEIVTLEPGSYSALSVPTLTLARTVSVAAVAEGFGLGDAVVVTSSTSASIGSGVRDTSAAGSSVAVVDALGSDVCSGAALAGSDAAEPEPPDPPAAGAAGDSVTDSGGVELASGDDVMGAGDSGGAGSDASGAGDDDSTTTGSLDTGSGAGGVSSTSGGSDAGAGSAEAVATGSVVPLRSSAMAAAGRDPLSARLMAVRKARN